VLAQIEDPANLARIPAETVRTALVLMLDTGLRSIDILRLPPEPVTRGRDGHPYLRFWNHKLRREHAVPLSERALSQIRAQQAHLQAAWPEGTRYLLPPLRGRRRDRHASYQAVLSAINRWLSACAVRGDQGEPVHVTPHQFRHSLATGMLNGGVPQSVVQRWLDHSSPDMTARYARLRDETVREEWQRWQERVNVRGEVVALESAGPLGDAAWMKDRVAQAKQTLPNGYCGLPLRQTCPHPNACLTCPSFLTDESFRGHLSEQLARTERLIARAEGEGQERMAQMNRTVAENLGRILGTLDRIKTSSA
jgi:integrase-like protein